MSGLFSLRHVFSEADERRFELELDADEPHLDHHRPNGTPILASVMGIEAMTEAARLCTGNDAPAVVADARILLPCLVSPGSRQTVGVSVRRLRGLSQGSFECALFTATSAALPTSAELRTMHHRATVSFESRAPAAASRRPPPVAPDDSRGVRSGAIYACFFHGPCYRVIAHAYWHDGAMICRFAGAVPPSHRSPPSACASAPQLLELALQTAGLWELACTGRMMIPDRIARIERSADLHLADRGALHAIARRPAGGAGIDIQILDDSGAVRMTISGYGTVPLPFDIDRAALERLARLLLPTPPPRNEIYGSCA